MDDRLKEIARYMEVISALQIRTAAACGSQIVQAADVIVRAFRTGNKVLLCGNGGSAADCQHMAAEFTNRLGKRDRGPLPALSLTTDTSFLTAHSNDYGFDGVFARQIEALGRPGDALIGISTSGNSRNVRRAMKIGRERGLRTIGLLGEGGPLSNEVDVAIVVPDRDTQHVQEAMVPIEHLMCFFVEREMTG